MVTIFLFGFVAACLFATAMWFPRRADRTYPMDLTPRAMHHEYLGAAMLLVGLVAGKLLAALGVSLMIDDAVQHAVQRATGRNWHSPLRRAYDDLYIRYAWLRALNRWLDDLFGRVRDPA